MLSAQPQRPMHQLSMDEMRQVFARVYGLVPDLDQCKYLVQENNNLLQAGQLIVVLDWSEGLSVLAGFEPGKPEHAELIPLTTMQHCEVVNYLVHECAMSFSSNVPESWLQKALTAA